MSITVSVVDNEGQAWHNKSSRDGNFTVARRCKTALDETRKKIRKHFTKHKNIAENFAENNDISVFS